MILQHVTYEHGTFRVAPDDSYLQFVSEGQHGRKWRLSPHMTRSEIVQTAFMAVLTWEEHECRERFKYKGQRVFGPHFNVEALAKLCEQGQLDIRDEKFS